MYKNKIISLVNTFVRWMIVCNIVGTPSLRRNSNPLSWNKVIRNISLDVDLMEMIILEVRPESFGGIYLNFVLCKV